MIQIQNISAVSVKEIEQARRRLEGIAFHTWVMRSRQFDKASGCHAFFKMENMQRTGSIEFRAAFNFVKAKLETRTIHSVFACASSNHAQAVALSANVLGLNCTIVMPEGLPSQKLAAIRNYVKMR